MTDKPTTDYTELVKKLREKNAGQNKPAIASLSQESALPLDAIKERDTNTRELRPEHVESLIESIAAIGLIEPLAVDEKGQLLAGGHRLAAIRQLKEAKPDVYAEKFKGDRILVRVMPFDATNDPDLALQVEVAENEQRRDYTPAEVRSLAERLKAAGYIDRKGRPSKGQKTLLPALSVIVGKSMRTLQRYIDEDKANSENATDVVISSTRHIKTASKALEKWQQEMEGQELSTDEEELLSKLPTLLKLMQRLSGD
ncbi:ParB/RepB/Spo0J family partition protein [Leptolyngbya sp. PL-A3]|uniref:ParB/RepB/Spo0J family partition protein n=1 Tax=Leptolyngbya sp. PL-A3 TaxID=2933911 RepID=UPI003297FEF7